MTKVLSEENRNNLFINILDIYNASNIAFKNTLLDLEEKNKIKIIYDKFQNNESDLDDINVNLETIHIQSGLLKTENNREICNKLINYATEKVCNCSYINDNRSIYEDTKRYLVNIFEEKDMIVNITDDAIIYLCALLEK